MIVQLSAVFCPSVQYLSFFCEAFSWTILDKSSFLSVSNGRLSRLGMPSLDFLHSHYTVLLSSFLLPLSCISWCCSLPCISQILKVQIISFSILSFCQTDQEFLQWPRVFFFWGCLPRISLAVSVTAVLKVVGDQWIQVCIVIVCDGERCNFPPITAWKV